MRAWQHGGLSKTGMILLAAIATAMVVGGLYAVQRFRPAGPAATVPQVSGVSEAPPAPVPAPQAPKTTPVALPAQSGKVSTSSGCKVKLLTIPWNGTMSLLYANGGRETMAGSLMEREGVRLTIERQDDYGKMQEAQLKFAEELKKNSCPSEGAAFTIIMGDGYSAYAAGIMEQMKKLGQSVEVIGSVGASYGEDACMLPHEVSKDPQKARGSLVGAVMRDGDYNLCVVWASQNGIPINPDEKTYDSQAMNFLATDSFTQADEGVISGKCEERPVVANGKRTGEVRRVCQNGTATWLPGDENVAKKKGGLAKVASTREYPNQMATIIVGNRDFMSKNPKIVEGILAASFAGTEFIRSSDQALLQGGGVAAQVFKEQNAAYWAKYFKGVVEPDKQGIPILLGGSRVMNAADNVYYFGLQSGEDVYRRVYTMFGDHYVKYYPQVMASYPKYEDVVNLAYVRSVVARSNVTAQVAEAKPTFTANQKIERVVAKRDWTIEFDTNKASIRPESVNALNDILNQLVITNLIIEIRGHTDNIGSEGSNVVLSRQRANAVKEFLMANAPSSFPGERVVTKGFGYTVPLADNGTPEGRAKNRRVEIIIGTGGQS